MNRVLRRIFGPKRDEGTRQWRKLHKEELNNLYCSPNIVRVRKNEMGGARSTYGRGEVYTGFWWGNLRERYKLQDPDLQGRIILKRIRKKWNGDMDWTDPAQDGDRRRAVVNSVMNLLVPHNAGNLLTR